MTTTQQRVAEPAITEMQAQTMEPPPRRALVGEARAAVDAVRMLAPLAIAGWQRRIDSEEHVIVVPGFGADDKSTLPLRHYLRKRGFSVEGWGLGRNMAGTDLPHDLDDLMPRWSFNLREPYRGEAGVAYLCDRLYERVLERHQALDKPIALVGWSLGGYLAREVARDLEIVQRVVTLGSPVVGGPKYTAAAAFFKQRGMDLDWIEDETGRREERPIDQPVTAIFSKSDGIVSWPAAIDRYSSTVEHIELDVAHLGMALNPKVWSYVVAALDPA